MSTPPPESEKITNVVIDVGNEVEDTTEVGRTSRPSRDVKPGSSGSQGHGIRPINPFAGENQHQRRPSKIDRILNGEAGTNEGTASNLPQPNVPVAVAAPVTAKYPSAAAPNKSNEANSSNRRSCLSTFDTCHIVLMFIVGIAVGIGLFCGINFGLRRSPPQALSPVEEILIVTPNPSPDTVIPPLTLKPTPTPSKSKPIMDTTQIPTQNPTPIPSPVPTQIASPVPTQIPTPNPTLIPSPVPTLHPTPFPTQIETPNPTLIPTPKSPTETCPAEKKCANGCFVSPSCGGLGACTCGAGTNPRNCATGCCHHWGCYDPNCGYVSESHQLGDPCPT